MWKLRPKENKWCAQAQWVFTSRTQMRTQVFQPVAPQSY